jgi:hypothetical protein
MARQDPDAHDIDILNDLKAERSLLELARLAGRARGSG